MAVKPVARQPRHFVERSRFFEKVRCSRHGHKLLFAAQLRERCPVQLNDLDVVSADNKQRRSPNVHQSRAGQIGTAASRDNRAHHIEAGSRRHQCGSGAGAGT